MPNCPCLDALLPCCARSPIGATGVHTTFTQPAAVFYPATRGDVKHHSWYRRASRRRFLRLTARHAIEYHVCSPNQCCSRVHNNYSVSCRPVGADFDLIVIEPSGPRPGGRLHNHIRLTSPHIHIHIRRTLPHPTPHPHIHLTPAHPTSTSPHHTTLHTGAILTWLPSWLQGESLYQRYQA